jgi:hypothetical protein
MLTPPEAKGQAAEGLTVLRRAWKEVPHVRGPARRAKRMSADEHPPLAAGGFTWSGGGVGVGTKRGGFTWSGGGVGVGVGATGVGVLQVKAAEVAIVPTNGPKA